MKLRKEHDFLAGLSKTDLLFLYTKLKKADERKSTPFKPKI
ncbi:hypothetical protein HMPREF0262_00089 [Clostridium sp. ATCC 29733]|nr:hypothetical protein HMPREF0262_00089 [Clostridium sp. ATCC 29733]